MDNATALGPCRLAPAADKALMSQGSYNSVKCPARSRGVSTWLHEDTPQMLAEPVTPDMDMAERDLPGGMPAIEGIEDLLAEGLAASQKCAGSLHGLLLIPHVCCVVSAFHQMTSSQNFGMLFEIFARLCSSVSSWHGLCASCHKSYRGMLCKIITGRILTSVVRPLSFMQFLPSIHQRVVQDHDGLSFRNAYAVQDQHSLPFVPHNRSTVSQGASI